MNWIKTAQIAQLVFAVLLMAAILLQSRGAGLSGIFGGAGSVYRTKRGLEKYLFVATIVMAVLFFGTALVTLVLKK
ncbi:MAG: preprotein translocase subunit SecG [Candidatus Falkowbacteria bacterium]|jgi:preprotein translocase subunit SecG